MASDLNSCSFIGRLGKDVETRYMTDGKAVSNITLAVGSSWKGKDGNKQEETEWVNVTVYGKLAEICGEYLSKGSQIYINGRMKTRKWQDKEGKDRYATEIIAENMQMLGGKGDAKPKESVRQDAAPAKTVINPAKPFDNFDDDCPFMWHGAKGAGVDWRML